MTILDKIVTSKVREVEECKKRFPVNALKKSRYFRRETSSLSEAILKRGSTGIIAEFKRKSPSAGILNCSLAADRVAVDYSEAGASAVSILTDKVFFGGEIGDINDVRQKTDCPVLRKDFIIDEYQVFEARAAGADAILLIAEILNAAVLSRLHQLATSLGLEVLVEVHEKKNIDKIPGEAILAGVNNRDLSTLTFNPEGSEELIKLLPPMKVIVAESGIRSVSDYERFRNAGYNGFLIGELFMRDTDPGLACKNFISKIKDEENKH